MINATGYAGWLDAGACDYLLPPGGCIDLVFSQFPLHTRVPGRQYWRAGYKRGGAAIVEVHFFVLLKLGIPFPPFPLLTLHVANHRVSIPWVTRSCFLLVPHTYLS